MSYYFFDAGDMFRWKVWLKGTMVAGFDANRYRKDRYGSWMEWGEHGNRGHKYGWEIDHIIPVSKDGSDDLTNLQPLHWTNNMAKGDGPG